MIELKDVTRQYRSGDDIIYALQDVNLAIGDGEMVSIVGPSGSGKSTLLNMIGLLDTPSSGDVILDGQSVGGLGEAERSKLRLAAVGFIFQRFHLIGLLSALENVMLPMEELGIPIEDRYARAQELLESVGLADRMHFTPARLSGGQRQRVAICRALANKPKLVLADEPTGELHSDDKAVIIELFRRFHREGNTLVIVTHDEQLADIAQRRIEIRDGMIDDIIQLP